MLFVTFHGGKPAKHALLNNVHAYDKSGKLLTPSVLDDTPGIVLNRVKAKRVTYWKGREEGEAEL